MVNKTAWLIHNKNMASNSDDRSYVNKISVSIKQRKSEWKSFQITAYLSRAQERFLKTKYTLAKPKQSHRLSHDTSISI